MNKLLEKISALVGIVTGIPLLLGWTGWVTGFFRNQNLEWQILFIAIILLCILLMSAYQIWILRNIVSPKKPKLIRPFDKPDTYIFFRGEWRRIPDWQTRDYLANLLDFQAGEVDIKLISPQDFESLQKGAPLESIFTYSRQTNQKGEK
jgi:hypothetical protein